MKIKTKSTFKISSKQLNFFLIQNLSIRNNVHLRVFQSLLKGNIFLNLLPSDLLKTDETFFLMLLVDCKAHFLYLKSMFKEHCRLYILQSQYFLAFQKTYDRYIYIYIYIYIYLNFKRKHLPSRHKFSEYGSIVTPSK